MSDSKKAGSPLRRPSSFAPLNIAAGLLSQNTSSGAPTLLDAQILPAPLFVHPLTDMPFYNKSVSPSPRSGAASATKAKRRLSFRHPSASHRVSKSPSASPRRRISIRSPKSSVGSNARLSASPRTDSTAPRQSPSGASRNVSPRRRLSIQNVKQKVILATSPTPKKVAAEGLAISCAMNFRDEDRDGVDDDIADHWNALISPKTAVRRADSPHERGEDEDFDSDSDSSDWEVRIVGDEDALLESSTEASGDTSDHDDSKSSEGDFETSGSDLNNFQYVSDEDLDSTTSVDVGSPTSREHDRGMSPELIETVIAALGDGAIKLVHVRSELEALLGRTLSLAEVNGVQEVLSKSAGAAAATSPKSSSTAASDDFDDSSSDSSFSDDFDEDSDDSNSSEDVRQLTSAEKSASAAQVRRKLQERRHHEVSRLSPSSVGRGVAGTADMADIDHAEFDSASTKVRLVSSVQRSTTSH